MNQKQITAEADVRYSLFLLMDAAVQYSEGKIGPVSLLDALAHSSSVITHNMVKNNLRTEPNGSDLNRYFDDELADVVNGVPEDEQ